MKIEPSSSAQPVRELSIPDKHPETAQAGDDSVVIKESTGLRERLEQSESSRADLVARAKALIASEEYPSSKTLGGVAGLLAKELQKHSDPP